MQDNLKYVVIGALVFLLVSVISIGSWVIEIKNTEIALRQRIEAQQAANKAEFDNMRKKILQNNQVSDKYKNGLIEVLTAYTEGRKVDGEQLMMKWSNEAAPTLSPELYKQLSNIIVSSRDKFTIQQKQLLDLQREYNTLINTFPNSMIFALQGTKNIEVIVVTSTDAEKAFQSGKEDDTKL